jgi:hypothetical protein
MSVAGWPDGRLAGGPVGRWAGGMAGYQEAAEAALAAVPVHGVPVA